MYLYTHFTFAVLVLVARALRAIGSLVGLGFWGWTNGALLKSTGCNLPAWGFQVKGRARLALRSNVFLEDMLLLPVNLNGVARGMIQ